MIYTLELGEDGHRYWLCRHDSGEEEPLPPGFALQFHSGVVETEQGPSALPVGSVAELRLPADPAAAEREAIMRVLVAAVRRDALRGGVELSVDDARAIVHREVGRILVGDKAAQRARDNIGHEPPAILLSRGKESRGLLDRLLAAQLGVAPK